MTDTTDSTDAQQGQRTSPDWAPDVPADDDERRRLLRELILRALL